ncbi:MAG: hypothetical protein HC892_01685 [Saprospiraceae bacterium]|nr:hypothetical protein [Saprospiraceae bacterium]
MDKSYGNDQLKVLFERIKFEDILKNNSPMLQVFEKTPELSYIQYADLQIKPIKHGYSVKNSSDTLYLELESFKELIIILKVHGRER